MEDGAGEIRARSRAALRHPRIWPMGCRYAPAAVDCAVLAERGGTKRWMTRASVQTSPEPGTSSHRRLAGFRCPPCLPRPRDAGGRCPLRRRDRDLPSGRSGTRGRDCARAPQSGGRPTARKWAVTTRTARPPGAASNPKRAARAQADRGLGKRAARRGVDPAWRWVCVPWFVRWNIRALEYR